MHGGPGKVMKHNISKNLDKGKPHRFGAEWPGVRCGCMTRRGQPCKSPAVRGRKRCRMHGGMSCGPTSIEGRARISKANLKSGNFTSEKKAQRRMRAAECRRLNAEIKTIEQSLINLKMLSSDWRKRFMI